MGEMGSSFFPSGSSNPFPTKNHPHSGWFSRFTVRVGAGITPNQGSSPVTLFAVDAVAARHHAAHRASDRTSAIGLKRFLQRVWNVGRKQIHPRAPHTRNLLPASGAQESICPVIVKLHRDAILNDFD